MPRFPIWVLGPETRRLILDVMNAYDVDTAIAEQETVRLERERGDQTRVERSRWLEEQHAERSFPCGLVPDQREVESGLPRLNVLPGEMTTMQVIAAVLPDDVVFIRDGSDDVVEVGRIPRTAIGDIDIVDRSGAHIPEPIHETIEEPQLSLLVLRWTNEGVDDADRFAFRSPWLAWRAGRKLMEARKG